VKYLVEWGADVNKTTGIHETPLFNACGSGNEAIVKYLVEHGAEVNKTNRYGWTPLNEASKSEAIVKYLVEHGAIK